MGFILALVWSFGGTHNEARKRLARAQVVRTLVVAAAAALLVLVAALVFSAVVHSQLAYSRHPLPPLRRRHESICYHPESERRGLARIPSSPSGPRPMQDFELIVIDNGSTDESLEIARSYQRP